MSNISKRDFLVLAPAAMLAATPALASVVGDDARLLDLERQRETLIEKWRNEPFELLTDDRFDAYGDAVHEIEQAILGTPAEGHEGLLVKWRRVQYWAEVGSGTGLDDAAASFDADLVRLIGGAT